LWFDKILADFEINGIAALPPLFRHPYICRYTARALLRERFLALEGEGNLDGTVVAAGNRAIFCAHRILATQRIAQRLSPSDHGITFPPVYQIEQNELGFDAIIGGGILMQSEQEEFQEASLGDGK
jgi:hypothetical protein